MSYLHGGDFMKIFNVKDVFLKPKIFSVYCLAVSGLEDEEDLSCPPDLEEVSQKCDVPGRVFITRFCYFCPLIFGSMKKVHFSDFETAAALKTHHQGLPQLILTVS